jgi:hypothetical protein
MPSSRRGDLDSLTLGWQRTVVAADDGEVTQRKIDIDGSGSGPPLAKPREPAWVSFFGDPSGTVDLARVVAHRHDGELNTADLAWAVASGRTGNARAGRPAEPSRGFGPKAKFK